MAGAYIDPSKPVAKAIITHSHSDHARRGSSAYLTCTRNIAILRHRIGSSIDVTGLDYGEPTSINGVNISFHPAGHIPGSSQVRLEYKGEVCVVSGDYKLEYDGLTEEYEPVKCNTFVTESTFALPVFKWDPQNEIADSIKKWWSRNKSKGNICVIGAYSLGKAQRLLKLLHSDEERVLVHSSIQHINHVLRFSGYDIPETETYIQSMKRDELEGALIIVPPASLGAESFAMLEPYENAFASGWMAVRGSRRWQSIDAGFGMSDHADWNDLNEAVLMSGAEKVFVTHGFTEVFAKWLREKGIDAEIAGEKSLQDRTDIDS
jgi:putative mRNA 3-end processing factor